jgi:serine O-acetyltransferase
MIRTLIEDARELAATAVGERGWRPVVRVALTQDSYMILVLWRLRCVARRCRIPGVNHLLRRIQTVIFGIELGNDIELGHGVFFVHPIGTVVGGQARVGHRVRLMGSNTVGTAKDNGCPVIGDDVVLGAGARVLGPVRVGPRAVVGANAVVLADVPPDSIAVGLPARVISRRGDQPTARPESEVVPDDWALRQK